MQNQSNSLITFDTQLKTALKLSTSAQLNHINSISCIFVRLMVLKGQGSKDGFVVMLVPHTSADRGANPAFEGRLNLSISSLLQWFFFRYSGFPPSEKWTPSLFHFAGGAVLRGVMHGPCSAQEEHLHVAISTAQDSSPTSLSRALSDSVSDCKKE